MSSGRREAGFLLSLLRMAAMAFLRALRDLGVEMPLARPRTCRSGHEPDAESSGRAEAQTQRFAAPPMTQGSSVELTIP